VVIFFSPGDSNDELSLEGAVATEELFGGISLWVIPVPWPNLTSEAQATLFYSDIEVGARTFVRWDRTATIEAAMDNFFDPDYVGLKKMLEGNRKRREDFEFGVMRLLNLLRIPVTWYGQGADDARPDLAGTIRHGEHHVTIVLVECCLEKPEQKYSGLRQRAELLGRKLGVNCANLLIVATPAQPPLTDYKRAAETGISLVGRSEIDQLLGMLAGRITRRSVLSYLRSLQNGLAYSSIGTMDRV